MSSKTVCADSCVHMGIVMFYDRTLHDMLISCIMFGNLTCMLVA